MFKSLQGRLQSKAHTLTKAEQKAKQLQEALEQFLNEQFPTDRSAFTVTGEYNFKEDTFMIRTDTKTVANEISLRLGGLSKALQKKEISVGQIIIK